MKSLQLSHRFLTHLTGVRGRVAAIVLLTLITPLFGVAMLWLVRALTDQVYVGGHDDLLPEFLAAYAGLFVAQVASDIFRTRTDAAITAHIALEVRVRLYRHILSLSPGSLRRMSVGTLISHLSSDVERVQQLIYTGPVTILSNVVSAIAFTVFLFTMSWKLTLCALVVAPFLGFLNLVNSKRMRRAESQSRELRTQWFGMAEERLGAVPLIQAFCAEERETGLFRASADRSRLGFIKTIVAQTRMVAGVEAVSLVGALMVIGVGAVEIRHHAMSVGSLVAFLGSVGALYSPVRSLAKTATRMQRARVAAERVCKILDTPSLVAERPGARELVPSSGAIVFDNVTFGYKDGEAVLDGVSFEARAGETLAIVGSSGAGKSTLARLAVRLYDPKAGRVLIDGVDVRETTLASLRRSISLVLQESHIMSGSIADNIRFGAPQASPEDVEMVAGAARAKGFISRLADGYEAEVGPRGESLSGGQRQRLAMARALLRAAPILILDEAAASLDSETEELVQTAVENLGRHKTLILVSHRLSSVLRADRVIVLDRGRVVEDGTPQVLMASGSRFRELFGAQMVGERPPAPTVEGKLAA